MLKHIKQHWSLYLTLGITILVGFIPIWINNNDQNKSLTLNVLSQVSLQPSSTELVSGLEISVDGTPVNQPFSSVIELKNNGRKPITTNDFEAPLEIHVDSTINIIRAQLLKKLPEDIDIEITHDIHVIKLNPTLWNPNDTILVSMITSGAQPLFTTKARIVGISSVPINDTTKTTNYSFKIGILLFAALAFAVPTMVIAISLKFFSISMTPKVIIFRKRTVIVIGIINFLAFETFILWLNDALGTGDIFFYKALSFFIIAIVVSPLAWKLEHPQVSPPQGHE
jgi:hypothetical protein